MVCLIQRNLGIAKRFHLTCCTISILSHWTVLVCNETWTAAMMQTLFRDLNTQTAEVSEKLGFILERSRPADVSYSTIHGIPNVTTETLVEGYTDCIITLVGTTDMKDDEIVHAGIMSPPGASLTIAWEILAARPTYQVLSNNCQDWARRLVQAISPNANCPPTIGDCVLPSRAFSMS
jgi:hypothetical protein